MFKANLFLQSQLSTRSLRQMLCGSLIRIWNLANHMKKQNKKHQKAASIGKKLKNGKLRVWRFLFHFLHVICTISNSNTWTAKHLANLSCTELTLELVGMSQAHRLTVILKTSSDRGDAEFCYSDQNDQMIRTIFAIK